jgi:DNA invertase Pin-like site-specific DNA recombinase
MAEITCNRCSQSRQLIVHILQILLDCDLSMSYIDLPRMMDIAVQKAFAYYRTSSSSAKDTPETENSESLTRQQVAVERYAKQAGYTIIDSVYDAAISGADPIDQRPGFSAMLARIAANGCKTIIVETASRFARDLLVAETGFRRLRDAGITLIASDAPNSFLDDTPTSIFIRQVLAAVQELDKAMTVAKLKGAKDRKRATGVKVDGRKSYDQLVPLTVARAKALRADGMTLRQITDALTAEGFKTASGAPYQMTAVGRMISGRTR